MSTPFFNPFGAPMAPTPTRAPHDLDLTRGDDVTKTFHWREDGEPIDTSDRLYAAQIRVHPDAETDWVFTPELDGPAGQLTLTMLRVITATIPPGRHYWDLEQTIDGNKSTVMGGRVTVWADVTR